MPILDVRGNPIDMSAMRREIVAEELSRSGGARLFAGEHPSVGLDPGKLGAILREAEDGDPVRYYALAEEMEEKDLHYLSVLGTRKRQVAQLDLTVEAASESAEDEANAELVRTALAALEEDSLFDMLDAVGKGASLTEIIWDMSERQWMPSRFCWVDPRMLDFDDATRRQMMLKTIGGKLALPAYKFIDVEMKAKSGLPVRGGIARAVAWYYMFKNYGIKDWVRFIEAYGQPLRVGKYAAGASDAEKRSLLRSVAALGTDAAAIIPQSMLIEFVESKSQGSAADLFEREAKYFDQLISKVVLGQTATTDAIAGGHAVGKEHNDVRQDIERADAKTLAKALTQSLVRPVVDLNRGPPKSGKYPAVIIGRPEEQDAALMIQAAKELVPLGLKVGQAQIWRAVGLKKPDDDDEVLAAPSAEPPADDPPADPTASQERPGQAAKLRALAQALRGSSPRPYGPYSPLNGSRGAGVASRRALAARGTGHDGDVEDLIDVLEGRIQEGQGDMIDQVKALLARVGSLEEARDALPGLLAARPREAAVRTIGEALELASLFGRDDIGA